jgi:hypothetical protein
VKCVLELDQSVQEGGVNFRLASFLDEILVEDIGRGVWSRTYENIQGSLYTCSASIQK